MMAFRPSGAVRAEEFSSWLDLFRWVAAYLVVIGHVGGPLLVSLRHVPPDQRTIAHSAYSFIAGYAHPAVMVFFVMSGLFVGGSLCAECHRRVPDVKTYLVKRFVRLLIVLIPSLIISYILVRIGSRLAPEVYSERQLGNLGIDTFICNAAFLQNVLCSRFAGNDSLWSLFNEFWYYMIFPFLAISVIRSQPITQRLLVAGIGLGLGCLLNIFQFSNAPLMPYMLVWLMGVWVAYAGPPRYATNPVMVGIVFVLVVSGIRIILGAEAMHGTTLKSFIADLIIGALFSKLLINLKHMDRLPGPAFPSLQHFLAGFSFTVYCIHLPIAYFYSAVMMSLFGLGFDMMPLSLRDWGIVLGAIVVAISGGYLLSLASERHTDALRRILLRRPAMAS